MKRSSWLNSLRARFDLSPSRRVRRRRSHLSGHQLSVQVQTLEPKVMLSGTPVSTEDIVAPESVQLSAEMSSGMSVDVGMGDVSDVTPSAGGTTASFQAIGLQDQFSAFGSGSIPPDTMGAVGPDHFVEVINSSVAIYSKTGTQLSHVSLTSFFTDVSEGVTPANGTFDPRVLYDQATGRWFATAMERGVVSGKDNDIILAVSDTSDPTGDWDRYRIDVGIPTGADSFFTDYSTLGVDENGVYIGMRIFHDIGNNGTTDTSFAKIAVTPKASLIAGSPSLGTVTQFSNITDMFSTPQPATNFDDIAATDPFFFVSANHQFLAHFNYRTVTWSGGVPTLSATTVVTSAAFQDPRSINSGGAPASGSTTPINTGDMRIQMALQRDGQLWMTRQVGVNSSGTSTSADRVGAEWFQLNVSGATLSIAQTGRIFDNAASNPRFYYYPSLAVTGQGHMRIGFSGSKSTEFVGAYSSGRLSTDAAGTTTAPVLIKAGEASYTRNDSIGRNRWGDYSYTSVDPDDDMTVWTIQQYAESNGTNVWGTWVSTIAAPTPTLDNPSATAAAGAQNVILNLTGTNFFDPGAGFPNHLDVQLTGGATNGITIDSVTYNSPTSATVVFDVAAGASIGSRDIVLTNPDGQMVTVVGGLTINADAGITITQSGGTTTVSEHGSTAQWTDTFDVVLNAAPSSNVVLTITSNDTTEASVNVGTLTFTPGNWATPQTVTVSGVFDNLADGNQNITVTVAISDAQSDDAYDAVADQQVAVTVVDIPNRPVVTGPTGTGHSSFPTFTWTDVAGEAGYGLYLVNLTTGAFVYANNALPADSTSFTLTNGDFPGGLAAGGYRFWLNSFSANGYSQSGPPTDFTVGGVTVPTAPNGFSKVGTTISWGTVSGATSYGVYVLNRATNAVVANQAGLGTNSYDASALAAGNYRIWVNAANAAGTSAWSAPYDFSVGAPPAAPSGLALVAGPTVTWGSVSGATSYGVYLLNRSTNQVVAHLSGLGTNSYDVSALAAGNYRIWVNARNAAGTSAWSASFDFTLPLPMMMGSPVAGSRLDLDDEGEGYNGEQMAV